MKRRALVIAGRRCQVCNRGWGLDGHHRTYSNLWREQEGDVVILCRTCHELYEATKRLPLPPAVPVVAVVAGAPADRGVRGEAGRQLQPAAPYPPKDWRVALLEWGGLVVLLAIAGGLYWWLWHAGLLVPGR